EGVAADGPPRPGDDLRADRGQLHAGDPAPPPARLADRLPGPGGSGGRRRHRPGAAAHGQPGGRPDPDDPVPGAGLDLGPAPARARGDPRPRQGQPGHGRRPVLHRRRGRADPPAPRPGPPRFRLPRGLARLHRRRRGLPLRLHLAAGHRRLRPARPPGMSLRRRRRSQGQVQGRPRWHGPAVRPTWEPDATPTAGGTMGQLAEGLLSLSGWAALAFLFVLPALEAPAFLGLVLPGEVALLLGGVLAHQGRIALPAALAVGVAGALAGDSAGYWIGRRWGPRLLTSRLGRRGGPARPRKGQGGRGRGGGVWALFVGLCAAGARVVLPGLAGMLGLRYRTFAAWTGVAATVWAVAHVLLGYAAGAGWRQVHQLPGRVGLALAGAVLVALAVAWLLRRARGHQDQ